VRARARSTIALRATA